MSDNRQKPCIRCLLRELGEAELLEKIAAYQDSIPVIERTEEQEYRQRLEKCRLCQWLNQGICGKCGCFVEARAFRRKAVCPHEHPRW